jgi:hypothetical protein
MLIRRPTLAQTLMLRERRTRGRGQCVVELVERVGAAADVDMRAPNRAARGGPEQQMRS